LEEICVGQYIKIGDDVKGSIKNEWEKYRIIIKVEEDKQKWDAFTNDNKIIWIEIKEK
jgi:hypothetical protein